MSAGKTGRRFPERDQLVFVGPLPSPLGRVAERSEVGRGFQRFLLFSAKRHPKTSSVSPSGCHLPQRGRQAKSASFLQTTIYPFEVRCV